MIVTARPGGRSELCVDAEHDEHGVALGVAAAGVADGLDAGLEANVVVEGDRVVHFDGVFVVGRRRLRPKKRRAPIGSAPGRRRGRLGRDGIGLRLGGCGLLGRSVVGVRRLDCGPAAPAADDLVELVDA